VSLRSGSEDGAAAPVAAAAEAPEAEAAAVSDEHREPVLA
jgi:hypothetical protein